MTEENGSVAKEKTAVCYRGVEGNSEGVSVCSYLMNVEILRSRQ